MFFCPSLGVGRNGPFGLVGAGLHNLFVWLLLSALDVGRNGSFVQDFGHVLGVESYT